MEYSQEARNPVSIKKEGRDSNRGRKDEARRADGHILLYHTGIRSAGICTQEKKKTEKKGLTQNL